MAVSLNLVGVDWPTLSGRIDNERPSDDVESVVFSKVRDAVLDLVRNRAVGELAGTYDVSVAQPGAHASLVTGVENDDNAILWTAKDAEESDITVALVDPDGNNESLDVTVTGSDIVVSLATDGSGDLDSDAGDVINAVRNENDADDLVSVDHVGESNGSGTVTEVAETPLAGGADVENSVTITVTRRT